MRKYISLFLFLNCILTLAACGKKADPITLPEASEITSIEVTVGENIINHEERTWISEVISNISGAKPSSKESIQDVPVVENYIKIDFRFETGTSTVFAYENQGKYYVEQPYQGIYEIDRQLYEALQKVE